MLRRSLFFRTSTRVPSELAQLTAAINEMKLELKADTAMKFDQLKADNAALKADTDTKLEQLKADTDTKLVQLKADTAVKFAQLKTDTAVKFDQLNDQLKADNAALKANMERNFQRQSANFHELGAKIDSFTTFVKSCELFRYCFWTSLATVACVSAYAAWTMHDAEKKCETRFQGLESQSRAANSFTYGLMSGGINTKVLSQGLARV